MQVHARTQSIPGDGGGRDLSCLFLCFFLTRPRAKTSKFAQLLFPISLQFINSSDFFYFFFFLVTRFSFTSAPATSPVAAITRISNHLPFIPTLKGSSLINSAVYSLSHSPPVC